MGQRRRKKHLPKTKPKKTSRKFTQRPPARNAQKPPQSSFRKFLAKNGDVLSLLKVIIALLALALMVYFHYSTSRPEPQTQPKPKFDIERFAPAWAPLSSAVYERERALRGEGGLSRLQAEGKRDRARM
jgi:hypothetical protein